MKATWVDDLPKVLGKSIVKIHSSIKLTPIKTSIKPNETDACITIKDNCKMRKPKFKEGSFVRTNIVSNTLFARDSTNWSFEVYTNKSIEVTIPRCYYFFPES